MTGFMCSFARADEAFPAFREKALDNKFDGIYRGKFRLVRRQRHTDSDEVFAIGSQLKSDAVCSVLAVFRECFAFKDFVPLFDAVTYLSVVCAHACRQSQFHHLSPLCAIPLSPISPHLHVCAFAHLHNCHIIDVYRISFLFVFSLLANTRFIRSQ